VYLYEIKKGKKMISKEASYIVRKLIFSKSPCWRAGPVKKPNKAASLENGWLTSEELSLSNGPLPSKEANLRTVRFPEKKQV
jgi:hypothetical protein